MRRALLSLALLGLWTGVAKGETVYRGPVADAKLALAPNGEPVVAYAANGLLTLATRNAGAWTTQAVFVLPSRQVELDGFAVAGDGRATVLVRERTGRWFGVATQSGSTNASTAWRWLLIRPGGARDRVGPAGVALDAVGRPLVAYALWRPTRATSLRLLRFDESGHTRTASITRNGFPPSPTLPAAAPVLMPSGEIRVVEAYAPAAIEWSPIPGDWQGQFLHSSALGVPTGAVAAGVSGTTVYSAWTEAYPTLGPPAVVLAVHGARARSSVALSDAVLAGLVVTPEGAELAANRCVDGLCVGLVGRAGLDGVIAGFGAAAAGARDLLLATGSSLDWYRAPAPPTIAVSLQRDLTGRVDGATRGTITLYRERAGVPRTAVGTFPLASNGSFAGADPTATPVAAAYRAVYVDPSTSIPYAALIGPAG